MTENARLSRRNLLKNATVATAAAGASNLIFSNNASARDESPPRKWDREADIVVIGGGAVGLPAAIASKEAGASVILVEAESHLGGHAAASGGNVVLGGGTTAQKKAGIEDSPDLYFRDLTDWTVVEPNGFPDYRYNDREIIRAYVDHSPTTYDWLVAHGVVFIDKAPDSFDGVSSGNSAPRVMHAAAMKWTDIWTGKSSTRTSQPSPRLARASPARSKPRREKPACSFCSNTA